MNMKKTVITITGPSGAGKDTAARLFAKATGLPVVCSYTTRPMRPGERDGREHRFVKSCTAQWADMLAYTRYGGYEYWTLRKQLGDGGAVYVVDEVGLLCLEDRFPGLCLWEVFVTAPPSLIRKRGASAERTGRDEGRKSLPLERYDRVIVNDGTPERLREAVSEAARDILALGSQPKSLSQRRRC